MPQFLFANLRTKSRDMRIQLLSTSMATCAQPVCDTEATTHTRIHPLLFVVLAITLPVLAGLAWYQASDNPIWPLMRNSLGACELRDAPLSPLSLDGLYRAHVVQASCVGRFNETLVFVTGAAEPWSLRSLNPDRAVLEVAGLRSLDSVSWQDNSAGGAPVLQLWFMQGTSKNQIYRQDHLWKNVIVTSLTSQSTPGADRLDY
jgi:hypothetical protein